MTPFLDITRDGAVVTLTMNRPEERNAISDVESCDAFVDACRDIGADTSIAAVILTGAGASFSAGGNLKKMRDRTGFAPRET
ncbi:enoyl-CoA hydratase-related protein, partial [Stenotrophomonas maltophilia]|uniref:enoyl-CoA hydratase-related protein n=1 Tax=Stenotrophomonas maltophilia TaxID=40324 RepID=UPI001952EEB1